MGMGFLFLCDVGSSMNSCLECVMEGGVSKRFLALRESPCGGEF